MDTLIICMLIAVIVGCFVFAYHQNSKQDKEDPITFTTDPLETLHKYKFHLEDGLLLGDKTAIRIARELKIYNDKLVRGKDPHIIEFRMLMSELEGWVRLNEAKEASGR